MTEGTKQSKEKTIKDSEQVTEEEAGTADEGPLARVSPGQPPNWARLTPMYLFASAILAGVAAFAAYTWLTADEPALTNSNPWGLYIVNYVFLIGASAGGVIVAAMGHAIGKESFRPVSRMAEIMAIGCLLMALTFIFVDMGQPWRGWHILVYASPTSPFIWNLTIIGIYLLIAMVLGYLGTRVELVRLIATLPKRRFFYRALALWRTRIDARTTAKERRALKFLAILAIPAAVTLHSVTAWIFGTIKAQPAWHSAIMAPLFVSSAIASGLGLVIIAALFFRSRYGFKEIDDSMIKDLGKMLMYALPVVAYLLIAEFITVAYAREDAHSSVTQMILFGDFAPVFWFDMIIGIALPIAMLGFGVYRSRNPGTPIGIASFLAVLGVFAERVNLVLPSFQSKLVSVPVTGYFPSNSEIIISLGIWCAGVLVFGGLSKVFPMVERREGGAEPPRPASSSEVLTAPRSLALGVVLLSEAVSVLESDLGGDLSGPGACEALAIRVKSARSDAAALALELRQTIHRKKAESRLLDAVAEEAVPSEAAEAERIGEELKELGASLRALAGVERRLDLFAVPGVVEKPPRHDRSSRSPLLANRREWKVETLEDEIHELEGRLETARASKAPTGEIIARLPILKARCRMHLDEVHREVDSKRAIADLLESEKADGVMADDDARKALALRDELNYLGALSARLARAGSRVAELMRSRAPRTLAADGGSSRQ